MFRTVTTAASTRGGFLCAAQRRFVVIGQDEEEYVRDVRGVPEYAERYYNERVKGEKYKYDPPSTDFDANPAHVELFEAAERNYGSARHKRQFDKSTDGMPEYKVRTPTRTLAERYIPPRGTEVIVQRYEDKRILGWNDDGLESRALFRSVSVHAAGTKALYRSFWRLVYKLPVEYRPRLARYLRDGFKRGKNVKDHRKAIRILQSGKQIFLRYVDVLARFETQRYLHDPVARFRHFEAEELERMIDDLDFYPYTRHTNELKPVKDIGFHKVYKKQLHVGSPGVKHPNAGLGRNVTRTFCQPRPRSPLLIKTHGRPLVYLGHSNRPSHWLRVHNRKEHHRPNDEFCTLYGD